MCWLPCSTQNRPIELSITQACTIPIRGQGDVRIVGQAQQADIGRAQPGKPGILQNVGSVHRHGLKPSAIRPDKRCRDVESGWCFPRDNTVRANHLGLCREVSKRSSCFDVKLLVSLSFSGDPTPSKNLDRTSNTRGPVSIMIWRDGCIGVGNRKNGLYIPFRLFDRNLAVGASASG